MEQKMRLQKYFTDCGVLSRRAAEKEIAAGRVLVNGTVATVGQVIDPVTDTVTWRGKRVMPTATEHHYILLNKPRGFVTTLSDEKGRGTVADLVARVGARVYPVGRLDMDSDGLLLLTDDGVLTHALTHPRHEIPKHYRVTVKGAVGTDTLVRLNESFLLDGYKTLPAKVASLGTEGGNTLLSFELFEGRNRQIRRMCEEVGLKILRLSRIAIGDLALGSLKEGTYRHLTEEEVAYLYRTIKKAP
ncbi:MAG: rRNA pseudouridine synthase [Clostridia bacterium]|nr:rRNA pseudouridine synthase [Clostridia bacterium]